MGFFNFDLNNPQTSFEWMIFLINKYLKMFLDGTWLTLYIAVLGTIFGFILGYIVGIVQDMKIGLGDNIVKKSMVRLLKSIAATAVLAVLPNAARCKHAAGLCRNPGNTS